MSINCIREYYFSKNSYYIRIVIIQRIITSVIIQSNKEKHGHE